MLTRIVRKVLAEMAIAIVVVAQLLVAAYACPVLTLTSDDMQNEMAERGDTMVGCGMDDPINPNLCRQYCGHGDDAATANLDTPLPLLAFTAPIAIAPELEPKLSLGPLASRFIFECGADPPPLVRFHVLRI